MLRKVLVLVLLFMMLVPSVVFADTYPFVPTYIDGLGDVSNRPYYLIYSRSGYTCLMISIDPLYYYYDSLVASATGYSGIELRLINDEWTFYSNYNSITLFTLDLSDFYNSNYTVYNLNSTEPFFIPPPLSLSQMTTGEMMAPMTSWIPLILPIILGTLVLLIGFWKAWRMLLQMLSRA